MNKFFIGLASGFVLGAMAVKAIQSDRAQKTIHHIQDKIVGLIQIAIDATEPL